MSTETKTRDLIQMRLSNKDEVYAAYMGFIREGALFYHTKKSYDLGDLVSVELQLMDEPDRYYLNGSIIWITPVGAQGGMPPGVGIKFEGSENERLNKQITTYVAGMDKSGRHTDTL